VDDEQSIVDIVKFNLQKEGFETSEAYDGEEALRRYEAEKPALILLDVMLPGVDGFEVCRRIRQTDKLTPIIMATARTEEIDTVFALDLGADDYVTKPFSMKMLLAHVNANLRRTNVVLDELAASPSAEAPLYIDEDRFDVFIHGRPADLTPREFELLKFLAASPDHVFSREDLLRDVWQYDYFGDLRSVDVAIRRLREKIEEDSANPKYILTKRGVGYYYEG
jgi:two-component system response regulator VicR